jgi:isoleucyl-tRNA synthetase
MDANVDGFSYSEKDIELAERPEIDRWVISKLNTLCGQVSEAYENYEPTKAGRLIQEFAIDQLSNWYVRLCRRRFWRGEYSEDKISAYQTLYTCLETLAILSSPIAPFYSDRLFQDLNKITNRVAQESVHLCSFTERDEAKTDSDLEEKMTIAQRLTSLVLGLRRKEQLKVRQPLQKIMVPILDADFERRLRSVEDLILSEVNVKELQYLNDTEGVLVKRIKPDFKVLGPKYGKMMKEIAATVNALNQDQIAEIEKNDSIQVTVGDQILTLTLEDVEISTQDIPGWTVASEGKYTVALDISISDDLKNEGIAREFVNRIQNLRKDSGLEVTDRILLRIQRHTGIDEAIENNLNYICSETLANNLELLEQVEGGLSVEIDEEVSTKISIEKLN